MKLAPKRGARVDIRLGAFSARVDIRPGAFLVRVNIRPGAFFIALLNLYYLLKLLNFCYRNVLSWRWCSCRMTNTLSSPGEVGGALICKYLGH